MENPIIEVHGVGKKFVLLHNRLPYETFRDAVTDLITRPLRRGDRPLFAKEDFWALRDIDFEVQKGEVLGIIGPNGSGKSTLLKILSQITPPTKGEITIRGHVASLLEVGTGFHPELTGRENIQLNGAILGISRVEIARKFDEIVTFAGVERFLDTPVKRYSSGMLVRLAFSVAAHMEPEILVIDEVLAVGDMEFQKKCLEKMESITRTEGRTILFVSHNLIAVQRLCTRTLSLKQGRINHVGDTAEVVRRYLIDKSAPVRNPDLTGRTAVGNVHFTDIQITNLRGSGDIRSDDGMRFQLAYISDSMEAIQEARVVITVESDLSHQVVLRLDTDVASKLPAALPPQGSLVCETGPVNLSEGKYIVNIDFLVQGTSRDYVKRAAEFDVEIDESKYGYRTKPDRTVCDHVVPYGFHQ